MIRSRVANAAANPHLAINIGATVVPATTTATVVATATALASVSTLLVPSSKIAQTIPVPLWAGTKKKLLLLGQSRREKQLMGKRSHRKDFTNMERP